MVLHLHMYNNGIYIVQMAIIYTYIYTRIYVKAIYLDMSTNGHL